MALPSRRLGRARLGPAVLGAVLVAVPLVLLAFPAPPAAHAAALGKGARRSAAAPPADRDEPVSEAAREAVDPGAPSGPTLPREVALADLDPRGPWRIRRLRIEGVGPVRSWLLRSGVGTETRPFWAFWRARPEFSPAYLQADLERVRRELEAEGYYSAQVDGRVTVLQDPSGTGREREPGLVDATIAIDEGPPVRVCRLDFDIARRDFPAADFRELRRRFPFRVGDVFEQRAYEQGAALLTAHLRSHGYADGVAKRKARVDVPSGCADVVYRVRPGESAVFGPTEIEGLDAVDREIAERELAYRAGEIYDEREVTETIRRLRALRIFSVVRLQRDPITDGDVPMRLSLTEGPSREIRLGIGYSTDDGPRGLASWWHYNFLGDGRLLGFSARVSEFSRSITGSFLQPHFLGFRSTARLDLQIGQEDESTYVDDFVLLTPRIEWQLWPNVAANVFFGFHYDSLSGVSDQTKEALGVFQSSGFTNAFGLGLRWQWVNDPIDPRRGIVAALSPEVAGGPLGGDFSHFRLVGDVRGYLPVYGDLVLATRVLAGSVAPYDGTPQIPLWARFYAGGTTAFPVRGYARRRVGPLSASNDPLGGRTATVVSAELRHPIVDPVWGVVFVDAGDVELSAWTLNPRNFQTGVGFGIRAVTPIGPIEAALGFGLNREGGDSLVQFAFTIGPDF